MDIALRKISYFFLCVILLGTVTFSSCKTDEEANDDENKSEIAEQSKLDKATPANDDSEALLNIVRLPELPDEVVWKELQSSQKSDEKKLIAVLKYTKETTPKLLALIGKNKQAEHVEVETENWFPEELTAQTQLSGTMTLKGTVYGANDFFNTPYGFGKITNIDNTDFFILELTTN